jgi:hypothetical protein
MQQSMKINFVQEDSDSQPHDSFLNKYYHGYNQPFLFSLKQYFIIIKLTAAVTLKSFCTILYTPENQSKQFV